MIQFGTTRLFLLSFEKKVGREGAVRKISNSFFRAFSIFFLLCFSTDRLPLHAGASFERAAIPYPIFFLFFFPTDRLPLVIIAGACLNAGPFPFLMLLSPIPPPPNTQHTYTFPFYRSSPDALAGKLPRRVAFP